MWLHNRRDEPGSNLRLAAVGEQLGAGDETGLIGRKEGGAGGSRNASASSESPAVCKNFRRASFMLRVLHDAHCRAPVLLRRGALPLDRILREQPGDERGVEIRSNLHYRAIYKAADPAIPVVELETILRRG